VSQSLPKSDTPDAHPALRWPGSRPGVGSGGGTNGELHFLRPAQARGPSAWLAPRPGQRPDRADPRPAHLNPRPPAGWPGACGEVHWPPCRDSQPGVLWMPLAIARLTPKESVPQLRAPPSLPGSSDYPAKAMARPQPPACGRTPPRKVGRLGERVRTEIADADQVLVLRIVLPDDHPIVGAVSDTDAPEAITERAFTATLLTRIRLRSNASSIASSRAARLGRVP